jgi:histidine triad (HIT) family protein
MTETLFDKILQKKVPADIVFENEYVLAFKDINPQAPVHVLVIPKKKIKSFAELTKADTHLSGIFFQHVAIVAEKLDLVNSGYRIIINHGKHGQQTVEYIHAHILGNRQLNWPPG